MSEEIVDKYLKEVGWVMSKHSISYAWLKQLVERLTKPQQPEQEEAPLLTDEQIRRDNPSPEMIRGKGAYGDARVWESGVEYAQGFYEPIIAKLKSQQFEVCPECLGKPYVYLTCPICHGTGKVPKATESPYPDDCPECSGKREVDALSDDGFGYKKDIRARCPICHGTGKVQQLEVCPDDSDRIYPCDDCGKLRTKAEGGTTFTVCEECWGYPR